MPAQIDRCSRRVLWSFLLIPLLTSCGTYSALRPADTLRQGQFEVLGGVSANSTLPIFPLGRASYGLRDGIEIGGQLESTSTLTDIRFGLLGSEEDGIALAVGLTVGLVDYGGYRSDDFFSSRNIESERELTIGLDVTVGRRIDNFDLYLGLKALPAIEQWEPHFGAYTGKLGMRANFDRGLFFGVEAGVTANVASGADLWLPEGALVAGVKLSK